MSISPDPLAGWRPAEPVATHPFVVGFWLTTGHKFAARSGWFGRLDEPLSKKLT